MQLVRCDIAYAVIQLSRACSKPAMTHMAATKRVLLYTKGTPDLAIVYKRGEFGLRNSADASFAANPDSHKSRSCYALRCTRKLRRGDTNANSPIDFRSGRFCGNLR